MSTRNRTLLTLAVAALVSLASLSAKHAAAAPIVDATYAVDTNMQSTYFLTNTTNPATWTINSGVTLTIGRFFLGADRYDQTLTLTGGGTLNLFGTGNMAFARIGHSVSPAATGTLVIDGGVSVFGNDQRLNTDGGGAVFTIIDGLADFSAGSFSVWAPLAFSIADNNATLIVAGQIDDAADFASTFSGAATASVTASGSSALSFSFDGTNTTITAPALDVDAVDYITLKTHIGQTTSAGAIEGDFDENGTVDWDDLQILRDRFGASGTATDTIPEPATLFIMLGAGLPALLKRRRLVTA